jgi:hypothetical protein
MRKIGEEKEGHFWEVTKSNIKNLYVYKTNHSKFEGNSTKRQKVQVQTTLKISSSVYHYTHYTQSHPELFKKCLLLKNRTVIEIAKSKEMYQKPSKSLEIDTCLKVVTNTSFHKSFSTSYRYLFNRTSWRRFFWQLQCFDKHI